MKIDFKNKVSVIYGESKYPDFEYSKSSHLFNDFKKLFSGFGLDPNNPFREYIYSGQTALIKPNWVRDKNPLGYNNDSLITHTSIIKYIIDFLAIAMNGRGKIIIGDAPLQNCDFSNLKKQSFIDDVLKDYKKSFPDLDIVVEDWRITKLEDSSRSHSYRFSEEKALVNGYKLVDLGQNSFLEDISDVSDKFRVTKYKPSLIKKHHKKGLHQYLISESVLNADFIINVPKLKTHIKSGLTGAMKNFVGVNGHKEFLPHHIKGSYFEGGDNYCNPSFFKKIYENLYDFFWENSDNMSNFKRKIYNKTLSFIWAISNIGEKINISAGSWRGNETIWRTTIDLNHIVYLNGKPKKILNIVDGIVCGQSEGPLEPKPKDVGMLILGDNPALVDLVISKTIGYNHCRIPTVFGALRDNRSIFALENSIINSNFINIDNLKNITIDELENFNFEKPKSWLGA